jgi:hypothetical protein
MLRTVLSTPILALLIAGCAATGHADPSCPPGSQAAGTTSRPGAPAAAGSSGAAACAPAPGPTNAY